MQCMTKFLHKKLNECCPSTGPDPSHSQILPVIKLYAEHNILLREK